MVLTFTRDIEQHQSRYGSSDQPGPWEREITWEWTAFDIELQMRLAVFGMNERAGNSHAAADLRRLSEMLELPVT